MSQGRPSKRHRLKEEETPFGGDAEEESLLLRKYGIPLVDPDVVERAKEGRKVIGRGQEGGATAFLLKEGGRELRVKVFDGSGLRKAAVREAANLRRVQGVVGMERLVGVSLTRPQAVVTLFSGEALGEGLERGAFGEAECVSIVGQLLLIAHHLRRRRLCPCDLGVDNVAVRRTGGDVVVTLVDLSNLREFGHVPDLDPEETGPDRALELYHRQPLTEKSQIYQVGRVVQKVLSFTGGLDGEFDRRVSQTTLKMRRERPSARELLWHWKRVYLKSYFRENVGGPDAFEGTRARLKLLSLRRGVDRKARR